MTGDAKTNLAGNFDKMADVQQLVTRPKQTQVIKKVSNSQ